ncbi:MAG: hypothetical protein AAF367_04675 [Pseudomonadota bacterium]
MAPRDAADYLGFTRREVIAWAKGEDTPPPEAYAKMYFLFDEQEAEATRILEDWELAGKPTVLEFTVPANDETAKAAGWPCQPAYMVAVAMAQATLGPVEIKLLYR